MFGNAFLETQSCAFSLYTLFSSIYFIPSVSADAAISFVPPERYIPDIYQSDDRRESRANLETKRGNRNGHGWRVYKLEISPVPETGTSPRVAQNESRKCNSKHWMEQWNRIVEWRLVQLTRGSLTSFCRSTTMKRASFSGKRPLDTWSRGTASKRRGEL